MFFLEETSCLNTDMTVCNQMGFVAQKSGVMEQLVHFLEKFFFERFFLIFLVSEYSSLSKKRNTF